MKITNIKQRIYTTVKTGIRKAFEVQKPKVTGLLPDVWEKSPTTGLTRSQLIDFISKILYNNLYLFRRNYMTEITREEFSKIYKEQFLPILEPLEKKRIENKKKLKPFEICIVFFAVSLIIGLFVQNWKLQLIGLAGVIIFATISIILFKDIKPIIKEKIFNKIILRSFNLYRSTDKNIIPPQEIKDMGLFPNFTNKHDDDIAIGIHKGCNIAINECYLIHIEQYGKCTRTVTDFEGLIVKIQMNKKFSGITIVGTKNQIKKKSGFEDVVLESNNFNKYMRVYSTDQIEARYILTPTCIERLYNLCKAFHTSRTVTTRKTDSTYSYETNSKYVSAAFKSGYVYLFIPTTEDFFEADDRTSIIDEEKYYDIYCQIQLILSIIEYLKLDLKLGL